MSNSIIEHQLDQELVMVEKTKTDDEKLSDITKRVLDKLDIVLVKLEKRKRNDRT